MSDPTDDLPRGVLLRTATVSLLSSFAFGLNNGMLNTPAAAIREALDINDGLWSACVSVFCLGALGGCNVWATKADAVGRAPFLEWNALVFALGSALQALSQPAGSAGLLLFGRLVSGVASGGATVVVPCYLGEIAPAALSGALGFSFQLSVTISMLAAQLLGLPGALGTPAGWGALLLSPLLVAAAQLALGRAGWLVESPRWLALRQDHRRLEDVTASAPLSGEEGGGGSGASTPIGGGEGGGDAPRGVSLRELLAAPRSRSSLLLCAVVMVAQQFSGINNAFNYSSTFLTQNGVSAGAVNAIAALMNLANVAVTCAAAYLVDRSGRRPLLLRSTAGMAGCALLLTVGLAIPQPSAFGASVAALALVAFVGAFGVGMGPIPWMLPAELFPTQQRATAASLSASCNWLANFLVAQAFLGIAAALHAAAFLPFAALLGLFWLYAYRMLPETRGHGLGADSLAAPVLAGAGGDSEPPPPPETRAPRQPVVMVSNIMVKPHSAAEQADVD